MRFQPLGGLDVSESFLVRANLFFHSERRQSAVTVALFTIAAFLYWVALYLYVPTLPTYVQARPMTWRWVGTVLSMYGLWQAIIRLPLGITVDWVGWRKPFIIIGFGLVGLGAWTMGTTGSVNGLTIGRAITGLAAGTWVLLVVGFTSLFPPQEAVRPAPHSLCAARSRAWWPQALPARSTRWAATRWPFPGDRRRGTCHPDDVIPSQNNGVRQSGLLWAAWAVWSLGEMCCCRLSSPPSANMPIGRSRLALCPCWPATGRNGCHAEHPGDAEPRRALTGEPGDVLCCQPSRRAALVTLSFGLLSVGIGIAALAPSLWVLFVAQACLGLSLGSVIRCSWA